MSRPAARVLAWKNDHQPPPVGHEHRKGAWIQTSTGRPFWPLDPRAEDIDERDIAHALANQCRFAGHVRTFYSVAEHSLRVALLLREEGADDETQLWGLMHDAPEAYLVDLPRPLKHAAGIGPKYQAYENRLMEIVCERYSLPPTMPAAVEAADVRLLETEARDLLGAGHGVRLWSMGVEPLTEPIHPYPPSMVEHAFLRLLAELTGRELDPVTGEIQTPTPEVA